MIIVITLLISFSACRFRNYTNIESRNLALRDYILQSLIWHPIFLSFLLKIKTGKFFIALLTVYITSKMSGCPSSAEKVSQVSTHTRTYKSISSITVQNSQLALEYLCFQRNRIFFSSYFFLSLTLLIQCFYQNFFPCCNHIIGFLFIHF